jgi:hypothetical protein
VGKPVFEGVGLDGSIILKPLFTELELEGVVRINLAQDRDKCRICEYGNKCWC